MTSRTNLTATVCSLLALGLVACGGGGGGDDNSGKTNTPPANSKAKINESNAKQVSQSTAKASNSSGKGAQSGAGAFENANSPQSGVPALALARGVATRALDGTNGPQPCAGGGTLDLTFEGLPTTEVNQLPSAIVVTAVNCVEERVTTNGVMRLSELQLNGNVTGMTILYDSFSVIDPGEQVNSTLTGKTTFLIESTATTQTITFAVSDLQIKEGDVLTQIPRLDTIIKTNLSTNEARTSIDGTVQMSEGLVDLVTEKPFVSLGEQNPTEGQLKIVGELSSVTLVPRADGETLDLLVDNADADPGVDAVVPATWDELGPFL